MDKIYKLLPWLTSAQAVDWLCRLTDTEMTEPLLISLCEAGHAQIFVDVGAACPGLDYDDWITEVIASGYQMVVDPAVLRRAGPELSTMPLHGEVLDLSPGSVVKRRTVAWFPNNLQAIHLCLKQAGVLALADKINADEAAEKAALLAEAERNRKDREQALHSLHEAQEEIADLCDKLAEAKDLLAANESIPSTKNSSLLAIAGLLRLIKDHSRPKYNQTGVVEAIGAMGWPSAGSSTLTHLFAEANRAAKDADSEVIAKRDVLNLAVQSLAES